MQRILLLSLYFAFNIQSSKAVNGGIELEMLGWHVEGGSVFGDYLMKNTTVQRIVLWHVWYTRNNTHHISPYLNNYRWDRRPCCTDSIVLEPCEERIYNFSSNVIPSLYNDDFKYFYECVNRRSRESPYLSMILDYTFANSDSLMNSQCTMFFDSAKLVQYEYYLNYYLTPPKDFKPDSTQLSRMLYAARRDLSMQEFKLAMKWGGRFDRNEDLILAKLRRHSEKVWEKSRSACYKTAFPSPEQMLFYIRCDREMVIKRGKQLE